MFPRRTRASARAPPTDRRYYPLFAECVELGVPFCTQVGHTGPLRPSETGRPIPYIDEIALDFPELVIVCGHIGYPWTDEAIAVGDFHTEFDDDARARDREETKRLLYVAITRAREKLYLAAVLKELA